MVAERGCDATVAARCGAGGAQVGQVICAGSENWKDSGEADRMNMQDDTRETQNVERNMYDDDMNIVDPQMSEGLHEDVGLRGDSVCHTIMVSVESTDLTTDIATQITTNTGMPMDRAYMTRKGKNNDDNKTLKDDNIENEDTVHICDRIVGRTLTLDDIKAAFNKMETQMHQLQSALAWEQARTVELKQEKPAQQRRRRHHQSHQAQPDEGHRSEEILEHAGDEHV